MKRWAAETNSMYIVIMCKDHRVRYPYMNYAEIFEKYGKKWNLLTPNVALSDAMDSGGKRMVTIAQRKLGATSVFHM